MGSIPVDRGPRFFLCPTLLSCSQVTFHISLPSLKFITFIHLSIIIVLPFDVEIGGAPHNLFVLTSKLYLILRVSSLQ